jgi:putative MATE family efflux protein
MAESRGKSMTQGKALDLILRFSIPLLLGNLFQQAYNLTDAAIVGRTLGSNALASVGVSSSVQFLVLGFCIGMPIGFTIPVASSFGARDYKTMRRYVWIGGVLTALFAALLTALTVSLCGWILHTLQTPAEIYADAYAYLVTIFWGISCTLLYNYLSGILRAIGDSKTPFLFLAFSATLNIFLDFFCILNLHWGCFGAALATIVSQGISGLLCLWTIRRRFAILHPQADERSWDGTMALKQLDMGLPMGLQYSITAIGSMVMQTCNNTLGTVYVSAYAAGLKIKQLAMCPFDAFGTAAATFCSQNCGARQPDRIQEGVRIGVLTALVYSVPAMLLLVFGGRSMTLLFLENADPAILDASARYLRDIGFFYPMLGLVIVLRQMVQSIGFSRRAMTAGVIEMCARCAVCMLFTAPYGFAAICCADQSAWTSAVLYLIPVLASSLKTVRRQLEAPSA